MTASAQSSGVAERWSGATAAMAAWTSVQPDVHGVSTSPGATALTRTGAHDFARRAVMWLRAALLIAYAIDDPPARMPATDVMLTTFASGDFFRCGIAALVSHHVPKTLTSNV